VTPPDVEPTAPAPRSPGPRRLARRVLKALGAMFALAGVTVAILTLTPWGLGLILDLALASLHGSVLDGEIRYHDVQGRLLSGFEVRGVEIDDARGEPLARVEALAVTLALRPLLQGEVRLDRLHLRSPRVFVDLDVPGTGWSRLAASGDGEDEPVEGSPPSVGPPFSVRAPITIEDGEVALFGDGNGPGPRFSKVALSAEARYQAPDWRFRIDPLEAQFHPGATPEESASSPPYELRAEATAGLDPVALTLERVRLEIDEASVEGEGRVALDGGVSTRLDLDVPASWRRLPDEVLPRGARAELQAVLADGRTEGQLLAHTGTSTATVRFDVDLDARSSTISAALGRLRARDVLSSAPQGEARGRARARARWSTPFDPSRLWAEAELDLSGELPNGSTAESLTANLALRRGRVMGETDLRTGRSAIHVDGVLRVSPNVLPERLVVTATLPDLSRFAVPGLEMQGQLRLSGRGRGSRRDWGVELSGRGEGLQIGPWSAEDLSLTATATGAPNRIDGAQLHLETRDNRIGPQRIGQLQADVRRRGHRGPIRFVFDADDGAPIRQAHLEGTLTSTSGLTLRLQTGRIRLADAGWELSPFIVRAKRDEGLRWRNISGQSEIGFFETEGHLAPGAATGEADLKVQIDDLRTLPFLDLPQGSLGGSAQVSWTPEALRGRLDASANGIRLGATTSPIDVQLSADLRDRVEIEARAGVRDGGEIQLAAELQPPDPWTEPGAWLKWRRISSLTLKLDQISVGEWVRDDAPRAEGRLVGAMTYRRSPPQFDVQFSADGVEAGTMNAPLGVSIAGTVDEQGTRLDIDSQVGTAAGPRARGHADVERDELPDLDEVDLAQRPFRLDGELPTMPLSLVTKLAGAPRDWTETATGSVSLQFALRNDPAWRVDLSSRANGQVRSGAPALDADVRLSLTETMGVATATIAGDGFGRVSADYRLDLAGAADLLSEWDKGQLRFEIEELIATSVRSLVVLPLPIRGNINASGRWDLGRDRGAIHLESPSLETSKKLNPMEVSVDGAWTSTGTRLRGRDAPVGADGLTFRQSLDRGLGAVAADPASTRIEGQWELRDFPARRVMRHAYNRDRFRGSVTSTGTVGGTLLEPTVDARFGWKDAQIGAQRFEDVRAALEIGPDLAEAQLLFDETDGGRLEVEGRFQPTGSDGRQPRLSGSIRASDFSIDFASEIAAIATDATTRVEGSLSADLEVGGDTEAPELTGRLELDDLELLILGALPRLDRGRLVVTTEDRQVDLQLDANSGPKGRVKVRSDIDLRDLSAPRVKGSLQGEHVEYLAGTLPLELDFDINFDGAPKGEHYELNVVIAQCRAIVTEEDLSESYAPIRATPDVVEVETFGVRPIKEKEFIPPVSADPLQLVVNIRNREPIRFRGTDSQAVMNTDLRVDVRRSTTRIAGVADVSDGTVALFGREYRIIEATVRFTESYPINPKLDVQLEHGFDRLTLTVLVGGRALSPQVRFSSQPSTYDQSQLLAFFAGLQNPDQDGPSGTAGQKAAGAAAGLLFGQVTKAVRKNLPIDTFDVSMGNGAPVLTVGKWLSEELFVAYTWSVAGSPSEEQRGLIRWRFYPEWALEVIAGFSLQSADVFWIRRF